QHAHARAGPGPPDRRRGRGQRFPGPGRCRSAAVQGPELRRHHHGVRPAQRDRQDARAAVDAARAEAGRARGRPGVLETRRGVAAGLRFLFLQRAACARPLRCRRRGELSLPCRVDSHASGPGDAAADDGGRRLRAVPLPQPERRNRRPARRLAALMDPLQALLAPVTRLVNRRIATVTPARELCRELAGKVVAVRVRNTGLVACFRVEADGIAMLDDFDGEPDAAVTGSLLTLARLAGESGDAAVREGALELTGDADVARRFQKLLFYGRPDLEEELSAIVGD